VPDEAVKAAPRRNDAVTYALTRLGRTTTKNAKRAETARLQAYFDRTRLVPEGNRL